MCTCKESNFSRKKYGFQTCRGPKIGETKLSVEIQIKLIIPRNVFSSQFFSLTLGNYLASVQYSGCHMEIRMTPHDQITFICLTHQTVSSTAKIYLIPVDNSRGEQKTQDRLFMGIPLASKAFIILVCTLQ